MSSFIGPFFAILFVVIFILMMQFLWLYIDELVGKGLSFKVILEFLGWGSATLIPLSLPLATLLSAVMTLGTLGENNELLAIKAAGISLKRVLAPLIAVSVIISIGAFFASNKLIPIAYNKIFTLRDDIGKTKEEIKIPTGTFYDGIDGYILRVNERDKETDMMHGVMVYNHTGKKGNTSLTIADSAMMKMSDDKSYLTFVLYSGSNYEETNTRKYRDTTLQLQKIEFASQEMVIPLENYAFKKSEDTRFGDEVRTMNLKQLRHSEDSIGRVDSNAKMDNIARFYKLSMIRTKTGAVLRGYRKIDLFYNKRAASIDGIAICFTFAPLLRGANGYLHEKDLLLVLDPVLRGNGLPKYPVRTIMIDPGHGGTDKGAPGRSGLLEKNLNLSMALKLRTALRKLGFQVIMTRAADLTLSLQARADLCEKFRPDLFLSIHCNAASGKTITGIETFAMTPQGCASSNDSKPGNTKSSGNAFDKNNYRLAYEIQKALLRNTEAEDRGVKHARFFVLRNASCPAVLIETGFISNQREGALLNRADYQAKIVNAIVLGILNYRAAYR